MNVRQIVDQAMALGEQLEGAAAADAIAGEIKRLEDPAEQGITKQLLTDVVSRL